MSAAEWIAKRREHLTAAAAANRRHAPLPFDQREVNRMAVALEALEAVLVFATSERDKISRTYIEQPGTAYAGYANAMDDVIRTIETELRAES